jgi:hypothetical protein
MSLPGGHPDKPTRTVRTWHRLGRWLRINEGLHVRLDHFERRVDELTFRVMDDNEALGERVAALEAAAETDEQLTEVLADIRDELRGLRR